MMILIKLYYIYSGNGKTKKIYELDYCSLLNRSLPSDIRVIGWVPVTASFNARFGDI